MFRLQMSWSLRILTYDFSDKIKIKLQQIYLVLLYHSMAQLLELDVSFRRFHIQSINRTVISIHFLINILIQLMKNARFVLFLLLSLSCAQSDFASFYLSYSWRSFSPDYLPLSTPHTDSQPYPAPYNSSYQYALALGGYFVNIKNRFAFDAYVLNTNASHYTITITALTTTIIKQLRFYLLVANPSSTWACLRTGCKYDNISVVNTNDISQYNTGNTFVKLNITSTIDITTSTDFWKFHWLNSFQAQSQPNNKIQVQIRSSKHPPYQLQLQFVRNNWNAKIAWVRYTVLIISTKQLDNRGQPYFKKSHIIQTIKSSNFVYLLNDVLSASNTFYIPMTYFNGSSVDGNCVMSMQNIQISGFNNNNYTFLVDTNYDPFIVENYLPSRTYSPSGDYFYQQFNSRYRIFCVLSFNSTPIIASNTTNSTNSTLNCSEGEYESGDQCLSCPSLCPTCISSSQCLSCINDSYFLTNQFCLACSTVLSNCISCTAFPSLFQYNCTLCQDNYIINDNFQCQSCSTAIPNCLNCSNSSYCEICIDITMFSSQNGSCLLCSSQHYGCIQCTQTTCTKCDPTRFYLQNSICQCISGTLVSGLCIDVEGCVSAYEQIDGTNICTTCAIPDYNLVPVNNICHCTQGFLVNGICNTIQNCMTPQISVNGSIICLYCDINLNFQSQPDSSGTCICKDKMEISLTGVCVDICGDGYVVNSSATFCDDNNTFSGDGCSSNCQVQDNYKCVNGSSISPSQCVYQGIPIEIEFSSVRHTGQGNQGIFTFSVSPSLISINRMNISQYYLFQCNSTYIVSQVDYSQGILSLTVDYLQDMENRFCNMTLSYDKNLIQSKNSTISFQVLSNNLELIYSSNIESYTRFISIFKILSYISLGIFCISIPHKLMGAELLSNCQLIYLSYCFYQKPPLLVSSLHAFSLVTGHWSFFSQQSDEDLLTPFTERTSISPFFFQNCFFVMCFLFLVGIFFIVLSTIQYIYSSSQAQRKFKQNKLNCLKKSKCVIYRWFMFPITTGFFLVFSLSGYINNLKLTDRQSIFPQFIGSFAMVFVWLLFGGIFIVEFQVETDELKGEKNVKDWFIPLFLYKLLLISFLIQIGIKISLYIFLYPILVVELIYLTILIFCRPYTSFLHSFGSIVCQISSISSLSLAIFFNYVIPDEDQQIVILFALEVLITFSILFTLFRLFSMLKEQIVNSCQKDNDQTGQQQTLRKDKSKFKDCSQRYMHPSILSSSKKDGVSKFSHEEETGSNLVAAIQNEELVLIKQRLRKDLKQTRKKINNPLLH